MKNLVRVCLCGMLMFSFFAVTGCGDTKTDPAPAAGAADAGGADTTTEESADAK